MRKLFLTVAIFAIFFGRQSAGATTIGSPRTAGKGKITVGWQYENIFNRRIKLHKANRRVPGVSQVKMKNAYRSEAKISYGLTDNLDIYALIGTSNLGDIKVKENSGVTDVYDSENGLLYGLGMKYIYEFTPASNSKGEWLIPFWTQGWLVGYDLQYLRQHNDWKTGGSFHGYGSEATSYEWSATGFIGKRIYNFTPYLGVKYSDFRIKTKWGGVDEGNYEKYKASKHLGLLAGTSYRINNKVEAFVETTLLSEKSVSAGITYRF